MTRKELFRYSWTSVSGVLATEICVITTSENLRDRGEEQSLCGHFEVGMS